MKNLFLLTITLLAFSCTNTNWDKELLYGKWQVSEWTNTSTNEKISAKMDFEFDADGNYTVDYGSEKESGKYWIMGDFLHTIEKGQTEKKVKLVGLDSNALKFEMNRGGMIEKVIFNKKK